MRRNSWFHFSIWCKRNLCSTLPSLNEVCSLSSHNASTPVLWTLIMSWSNCSRIVIQNLTQLICLSTMITCSCVGQFNRQPIWNFVNQFHCFDHVSATLPTWTTHYGYAWSMIRTTSSIIVLQKMKISSRNRFNRHCWMVCWLVIDDTNCLARPRVRCERMDWLCMPPMTREDRLSSSEIVPVILVNSNETPPSTSPGLVCSSHR